MADDNPEREREKADLDLISNVFYIVIGILFALGVNYLLIWLQMVKPIPNVNNYLALGVVMILGAIGFFVLTWWYRHRQFNQLYPKQPDGG
ncbi:MAG: hypothetical protein JRM80_02135 [Nitrososphaerota archaeon]|nr:hypothetical protein [Nitrososphaerota archaeon]